MTKTTDNKAYKHYEIKLMHLYLASKNEIVTVFGIDFLHNEFNILETHVIETMRYISEEVIPEDSIKRSSTIRSVAIKIEKETKDKEISHELELYIFTLLHLSYWIIDVLERREPQS